MRIRIMAALIACGLLGAAPAATQGNDLRGRWTADTGGRTCAVELGGDQMFGTYRASSFGCQGELLSVNGYRIQGRDIVLTAIGGRELARLSSRGGQLLGRTSGGAELTLRREGAPPVVADRGWGRGPRDGGGVAPCVTYGPENDRCATEAELALPAPGSSVRTLNMINLREGPGMDYPQIGALPRNVCTRVGECRTTDDGAWCRTELLGREGWVAKVAPRTNPTGYAMLLANRC
jgi:hypothetical protein